MILVMDMHVCSTREGYMCCSMQSSSGGGGGSGGSGSGDGSGRLGVRAALPV
jgi:hypothetical protein